MRWWGSGCGGGSHRTADLPPPLRMPQARSLSLRHQARRSYKRLSTADASARPSPQRVTKRPSVRARSITRSQQPFSRQAVAGSPNPRIQKKRWLQHSRRPGSIALGHSTPKRRQTILITEGVAALGECRRRTRKKLQSSEGSGGTDASPGFGARRPGSSVSPTIIQREESARRGTLAAGSDIVGSRKMHTDPRSRRTIRCRPLLGTTGERRRVLARRRHGCRSIG